MNTAELKKIAEGGSGSTFNAYNISTVHNLNPAATTVHNYNFKPVRPLFITKIINRLSDPSLPQLTPKDIDYKLYKIDKKEDHNKLKRWKDDIKRYAPFKKYVEDIYKDFDSLGKNKRESVYQWLHREYERLHDKWEADQLFDELKNFVSNKVSEDLTLFDNISFEEMENNVCIVLVDAFIECRIFEKP